MARHIVCLTFDFDAMSGFIARGMRTPTPISRGEFGVVGVRRILALLQKYAIPATFFVPGTVIETYPASCEAICAGGHELAHHGWSHVPPADLSPDKEEADLVRANESIRRIAGRPALGYRSPSWDLSPHTVPLLLKHGFLYDSSMMADDYQPYQARLGDEILLDEPCRLGTPSDLVEMPISWSLDDHPHFEYFRTPHGLMPGLRNAGDVLENWIDDYVYMQREADWGVVTYTCHPYVIGRGHRMMMLERLILRLIEGNAVFLTMEAAAREWMARPAGGRAG
jgi:peptidoglycan/xylan/chitin deacetylase (PgdA/CDA1 family)